MNTIGKYIIAIVIIFGHFIPAFADKKPKMEPDTIYTDSFLDTVDVKKASVINDYTLIGIQYGTSLSRTSFNPTKRSVMQVLPYNFGVTYTRYGKMFGYMPFFGFQTGLNVGQEGYLFKKNKDEEYRENVDGATRAVYNYAEVPMLAHLHIDVWKLKIIVNGGLFAGYRLSVMREGDNLDSYYKTNFYEHDRRFEYGYKVGGGIGIMLDPIEIHIQATYRYSLGSLYKPDYRSEYYYRFAYPNDIVISAGIHFQLTKRTGKTNARLRKEARETVYKTDTKDTGNKETDSNEKTEDKDIEIR